MRRALLAAAVGAACAQTASVYEITSRNFQQASSQPVAWLLQLESPWSTNGQQVMAALRPVVQQAAQYYNAMYTSKGVRVGRADLQQQAELRKAFCTGADCPSLVLMQNGRAQASRGHRRVW